MFSRIDDSSDIWDSDTSLGDITVSNVRQYQRSKVRSGETGNSRRDDDLADSRARDVEYETLTFVWDGRVKREDKELICAESEMSFESIGQSPDWFEWGEEDEDSARERNEVLVVETNLFEKHDDKIVIDRVVIHTVESDARLFRERSGGEIGHIGRSVEFVLIVERNVVASPLSSSISSLATSDELRIRVRVESVSSQFNDIFKVVWSDGMRSTWNSNDRTSSHVVGNLLSTVKARRAWVSDEEERSECRVELTRQ